MKGFVFWDWAVPMRYRPGINQYTEKEMKKRVKKLWFPLLYRGGFDILLTHSPAYQLNDGLDLPHQGFQVFNTLMDKYHPRFFIHGHVHMSYGRNQKRYDQYNQTHVINAYDRCVFDYEDDNLREHLKRMIFIMPDKKQEQNGIASVSAPVFLFLYLCFLTVAYSLPVRSVYSVLIGFFS